MTSKLCALLVARMERRDIRGHLADLPRFASLNAGYDFANPAALRPASRPKVAPDIRPVPLA